MQWAGHHSSQLAQLPASCEAALSRLTNLPSQEVMSPEYRSIGYTTAGRWATSAL